MPAVFACIQRSIIRLAPSAGRGVFPIAAAIALIGILSPVAAAPDDVTGTDDVSWSIERPQRQTVRAIHFIDAQRGWFVAGDADDQCVIMRTEDGGDTWSHVDCPASLRPQDIFFVNERTGWIVGGNGLILRSDDGGHGWGRQGSSVSATLTGIHAVDTQRAWISTRGGDILRTTDGGAFWDREGTGATSGLFDIHFFDRDHGWAVGSDGRIIRTQNGGRDWYRQNSGSDKTLTAVAFLDINIGWVVGHHIRFTTDGGGRWRRQIEVDKSLEGVDLVDRDFAWAVGDEGTIVLTRDGGATWTKEGDARRWEGRGVSSVSATDRGHMWAGATGGFIIRRIDTSAAPPPATELPPPLPTTTPLPPTNTPRPFTPTPTITPTPTPPWISVAGGEPILIPARGERRLDVTYGNMGSSEVMVAVLEGPLRFADGTKTYTTTVLTSGGSGSFPLVVVPDAAAEPPPSAGDELTLIVTMGTTTERLRGMIAHQAFFAWVLKNHPEWMLPPD